MTDCGELAALSVMSRVVERNPAASGVNWMEMVQEELAASEPVQLFETTAKSLAFWPLRVTVENCSDAFPELVTLRDWARLVDPSTVVPGKLSAEAGFSVTAGAGGGAAMAVPARWICCGLPGAESVTHRVAWLDPTAEGVNVIDTAHEAPGFRTNMDIQLSDSRKSLELEPLTLIELKVTDC